MRTPVARVRFPPLAGFPGVTSMVSKGFKGFMKLRLPLDGPAEQPLDIVPRRCYTFPFPFPFLLTTSECNTKAFDHHNIIFQYS